MSKQSDLVNIAQGDTITVDHATGRVGIGTSSPATTLDVAGTITTTRFETVNAAIGTATDVQFFADAVNTAVRSKTSGGGVYIQSNDGAKTHARFDTPTGDISFYEDTGTTPKFFWDASAEALGIGTSSLDSTLTVEAPQGLISVKSTTGSKRLVFGSDAFTDAFFGTTTAHNLSIISGGNIRATFDTSGNVGIGTSSPARKLHVATAGNNYIVSHNTTGSSALLLGAESASTSIYSWTSPTSGAGVPLKFFTGATESVRIDSSGNVGIGTTSPQARLHVANEQGGQTGRILFDANVTSGYETRIDATDVGLEFTAKSNSRGFAFNTGATPTERMRIDSSGTLIHKLAATFNEDGADADFRVESNNNSSMLLVDAGNDRVGIGRSPSYGVHAQLSDGTITVEGPSGSVMPRFYAKWKDADVGLSMGYEPGYAVSYIDNTYAANYGTVYGDIAIRQKEGSSMVERMRFHNHGLGDTHVQIPTGGLKVGRNVLNWWQWGGNPSTSYLHIKTDLWGGGGTTGNAYPTMSAIHITGYNYAAKTFDGHIGFHNWSGSIYSLAISNSGSHPVAHGAYVSSDGYVVLVLNTGTSYPSVNLDYRQLYPYTFVPIKVQAYSSSSSTTGVY